MFRAQIGMILVSALLAAGCSRSDGLEQPALTAVRAAEVKTGPAAPTLRTTGLLVNKDELRLSFKVAGVIKRIAVQEGQRVQKGQVLAEIEQAEINAQVEQAQQAADKAERDAARGEKLYADRLISLGQLQDWQTQAAMNKAALESAKFNRSYAQVVAPRDGTILKRVAREKEMVAVGAPVVVLGAKERGFIVRVGLADREVMQVRLGDRAQVKLDAYPQQTFTAQVTEIAGSAEERSGLFDVELRLDPTNARLASGLVAKLALTPYAASQGKNVYVPIGSIVEGHGDHANVYILTGDVVKRREVRTAFIEGDQVAVTEGLKAGERVITDGALYVDDGERVAVQTTLAANQ